MGRRVAGLRAYGTRLVGVLLALGVAKVLQPLAGLENVDLVFLTAVIAVAAHFGLGPSLVASVASVLAYNYFFIPPLLTFEVADPKNLAALIFFLGVRDHHEQSRRQGSRPGPCGAASGADHRGALRVQPRHRRHPGRGRPRDRRRGTNG